MPSLPIYSCAMLALLLCACNVVPADAPNPPSAADQDLARRAAVINLTPDNVDGYRAAPEIALPSGARLAVTAPPALLSPGDAINVRIFESRDQGLFATVANGGTQFGPLYVSPDGLVRVPFAGAIPVAGKTLDRLAAAIKQRVAALSFNPEVVVTYQTELSSTVTVSGVVKAPGRYSMLTGVRTALDAIDQAGGALAPPYQLDVVLRRGGAVSQVSLYRLMNGGDYPLRRDDDLIVKNTPRVFTGLGAVTKSGQYPLSMPQTSLLDALGMVGGLIDRQADRTGVIVFRPDQPGSKPGPTFFTLDFSAPISVYVAQRFCILPGDVLYVTNAPTVDWNKYLVTLVRALGVVRLAVPDGAASTFVPGE